MGFKLPSLHSKDKNPWNGEGCLRGPEYKIRECETCCTILGCASVGKAPGVRCKFLNKEGCELHGLPEQPKGCREYHCSYALNLADDTFPAGQQIERLVDGALKIGDVSPKEWSQTRKRLKL